MSNLIQFPQRQQPKSDEEAMIDRFTEKVLERWNQQQIRIDALVIDVCALNRQHRDKLFKDVPVRQEVFWKRKWPYRNAPSAATFCEVVPAVARDSSATKHQWTLRLDLHSWNHQRVQTEIEVIAYHRRTGKIGHGWWFYSLCPLCGHTRSGRMCWDSNLYLLAGESVFRCRGCAEKLRPSFERYSGSWHCVDGVWNDDEIVSTRESWARSVAFDKKGSS